MRHEQHIADRRLTLRFPNRLIVEARPYVLDQPIQPARHVRGRFPPWTPIPPYIPHLLPRVRSLLLDLRARQAFVVAVVPFPDVVGDLDLCFCAYVGGGVGVMGVLPGRFVAAANVEEFEGAAGAGAGGYVAEGVERLALIS